MEDFDGNTFDDLDDAYATVSMVDDDGNETEFAIISSVSVGGEDFLLVVESSRAFEDEAEAVILKRTGEEGEDSIFSVVEDDEEFDKAVALFQSDGDYEIDITIPDY